MSELYVSSFAGSNVGRRRQNNEDNYCLGGNFVDSSNDIFAKVPATDRFIASVCDGMGGEESGEIASQFAVETVHRHTQKLLDSGCSDDAIAAVVEEANGLICNEISKRHKRMGTTFTLVGIADGIVTASNIGDSRIYRFSDGILQQISKDHTQAQSKVDAGVLTQQESMSVPEKHMLTQHMGIFPDEMIIEAYTVRLEAKASDRYLLCSDGLTDMLTDDRIAEILNQNKPLKETVEELIAESLQNGGRDNVTVVLCEIQPAQKTVSTKQTDVPAASKPQNRQEAPRNKFGIKLLITVALIIIAAMVAVLVLSDKSGKTSSKTRSTVTVTQDQASETTENTTEKSK